METKEQVSGEQQNPEGTNKGEQLDYYWDETSKAWVFRGTDKYMYDGENYLYTDEAGKKYKWCSDSNSWLEVNIESKKKDDSESECESDEEKKIEPEEKEKVANKPNLISESRVWDEELKTYVYPDEDGTLYYWDYEKQGWIPKVDEDFLANYQMNYGFIDNVTEPVKEESKPDTPPPKPKDKRPSEPGWFEIDTAHNNKVYVSGLPSDIKEEDFIDLMAKCGLILKDPSSNKYKIKLYKDSNGYMKGDGLCTYIKVESVELALTILDGYVFNGSKIHVERAQFSMKGDYNPSLKPRKKRKKDKEKEIKFQQKLFDWRPDKMRGERNKFERVVVISNMFDVEEFKKDPSLILQYRDDLQNECSKCGTVKKIFIYDANPQGIAQVFFSTPEEADDCIKMMKGRWFDGRQLEAETWDGKAKYKMQESKEEESTRLKEWEKHLLE